MSPKPKHGLVIDLSEDSDSDESKPAPPSRASINRTQAMIEHLKSLIAKREKTPTLSKPDGLNEQMARLRHDVPILEAQVDVKRAALLDSQNEMISAQSRMRENEQILNKCQLRVQDLREQLAEAESLVRTSESVKGDLQRKVAVLQRGQVTIQTELSRLVKELKRKALLLTSITAQPTIVVPESSAAVALPSAGAESGTRDRDRDIIDLQVQMNTLEAILRKQKRAVERPSTPQPALLSDVSSDDGVDTTNAVAKPSTAAGYMPALSIPPDVASFLQPQAKKSGVRLSAHDGVLCPESLLDVFGSGLSESIRASLLEASGGSELELFRHSETFGTVCGLFCKVQHVVTGLG